MSTVQTPSIPASGYLRVTAPIKVIKARKGLVTVDYLGSVIEIREGDDVQLNLTLHA